MGSGSKEASSMIEELGLQSAEHTRCRAGSAAELPWPRPCGAKLTDFGRLESATHRSDADRVRGGPLAAPPPARDKMPKTTAESSAPPLQLYSPDRLAIGIMVVPTNAAYRAAARQTWLNEAIKHATAVFVAGDVACAHHALDREAGMHGDVVFVDSDDCQKWHSPAKIHAWYTYALKAYPQAQWIAKTEDDGMLWTKPLVTALGSVRQRGSVYAGMMQWQGGCEHSEARSASGAEQACAGCWGGWFNNGAAAPRHCMPMWRMGWSGSVKTGVPECPSFRLAPFACGPFEARTRHLALAVSKCAYAKTYFDSMSRRGNARHDWCVSADGGQGHAVGACVRTLHIADLGPHRQKYATEKQPPGD